VPLLTARCGQPAAVQLHSVIIGGSWPIDAHELPVELCERGKRIVDTHGLPVEVGVEGANDNPLVTSVLAMQANKVFAIDRKQRAFCGYGKGKHRFVGDSLPGVASIAAGEHVVTKPLQPFDDGQREVFVRV
jgi:hypothetical protein